MEFNVSTIYFLYLVSLILKSSIRLRGHKKVVISSINQTTIYHYSYKHVRTKEVHLVTNQRHGQDLFHYDTGSSPYDNNCYVQLN